MKIPSTLARFRRTFLRASKIPNESVTDWYQRIKCLAEPCRFGNDHNKFLLEVFISGLEDSLFDRLLNENCDLTFDIAIDVITKYEQSHLINDNLQSCRDGNAKSDEFNFIESTNSQQMDNFKQAMTYLIQVAKHVDEDNNLIHTTTSEHIENGRNLSENQSNRKKAEFITKNEKGARKAQRLLFCEMCPEKTFNHKANLRRHMESIHSNEINLTCHICGRCFRSDVAIRKHLLVHSGIKPFECELCGKTFSRNDKLKEHRNCHFGIKRYSCEFCEKCYTQRFNLVIHTRQEHTREKPFQCVICNKSFTTRNRKNLHMKTHEVAT